MPLAGVFIVGFLLLLVILEKFLPTRFWKHAEVIVLIVAGILIGGVLNLTVGIAIANSATTLSWDGTNFVTTQGPWWAQTYSSSDLLAYGLFPALVVIIFLTVFGIFRFFFPNSLSFTLQPPLELKLVGPTEDEDKELLEDLQEKDILSP